MTEKRVEPAEKKLADVKDFYFEQLEKEKQPVAGYRDYEMSPMSEYYVYGRGEEGAYNSGFRKIREDLREMAFGEKKEVVKEESKDGKKANAGSIFAFIFALIAVALVAVGILVGIEALNYSGEFSVIDSLVKGITGIMYGADIIDGIHVIGLAINLLFLVLTLITSLFCFKGRFPVVGKVFAVLAVVGAAVMIVGLVVNEANIGYGAIALAALTVIMAISALCARGRKAA